MKKFTEAQLQQAALGQATDEQLAEMMRAANIEIPTGKKLPYTGRVLGVAGAGLNSGLHIYENGPKFSNILGGVVGAVIGYRVGTIGDLCTHAVQTFGDGKTSVPAHVTGGLIAFSAGYGISAGVRRLTSGVDGFIKTNDDGETVIEIPVDANEPVAELY